MLWNELLRNGNISLLESQSDTQYCICRNYNPNEVVTEKDLEEEE